MIPLKDNIPTDRFPVVTVALIVANFVVYLLAIRHGGSFVSGPDTQEVVKYGAIPYAITHPGKHCGLATIPQAFGAVSQGIACQGQTGVVGSPTNFLPTWETVFSAMFMHASILHIGGNMLFLWIFGNNVEDRLGRIRYLLFYLFCGYAAGYGYALVESSSAQPLIGASGAIAGVLGAYLLLWPKARVWVLVPFLFFIPLRLPAWIVLGLWFVLQAFYAAGYGVSDAGTVAYPAHVVGFAVGLLLALPLRSSTPPLANPPPPNRNYARWG
jgi:membrane associated rhomboid family serine protease